MATINTAHLLRDMPPTLPAASKAKRNPESMVQCALSNLKKETALSFPPRKCFCPLRNRFCPNRGDRGSGWAAASAKSATTPSVSPHITNPPFPSSLELSTGGASSSSSSSCFLLAAAAAVAAVVAVSAVVVGCTEAREREDGDSGGGSAMPGNDASSRPNQQTTSWRTTENNGEGQRIKLRGHEHKDRNYKIKSLSPVLW